MSIFQKLGIDEQKVQKIIANKNPYELIAVQTILCTKRVDWLQERLSTCSLSIKEQLENRLSEAKKQLELIVSLSSNISTPDVDVFIDT